MKTKAAILVEQNKPLVIDYIDIPALKVGQVLVDIRRSGICGAQIGEITGRKGEDKFLPHLLGHEGAGIVLEIGAGVSTVKPGDHVVAHWRKGEGIDAIFPVYRWGDVSVGAGKISTFAEHSIISENRLTKIDKKVPFEIGALMGCAITTALGLINNEAQLKIGESIMILGCGGVGLNIILGARMVSANPIIAVDKEVKKLLDGLDAGACSSINTSHEDLSEQFRKVTGLREADVVVDTTGDPKLIAEGWALTKRKMILVGQVNSNFSLLFPKALWSFYSGKVLMDSQGGGTNPTEDIPRYLDLYLKDGVNFDNVISHRIPFESINRAVDMMKEGTGKRYMLEMGEDRNE